MHVVPVEDTINISKKSKHEITARLSSEIIVTESGKEQYFKTIQMAYKHYSLASTTVTGIPMKVSACVFLIV